MGVFVEYANLNPKYFSMGFIGGYNFKLIRNFDTVIGLESGLIVREFPEYESQKVYLFLGGNAITRWWFSEFIGLSTRTNIKYRNDLAKYYNDSNPFRFSGFAGLCFRF